MPAETNFQPAAYLPSRFASHLPSALRNAMSRPSYAVRQGTVGRNVAKTVERVRQGKKEMRTWTEAQAGAFLATVESNRLSPAWQLSLRGLCRGEVLGLCSTDIDFQNKTLTIRRERIEVAGVGIVEDEPKTARSRRTLPLDDAPIAALMALKAKQAQERLAGGKVYTPACTDVVGPISSLMRSAAASVPSGIPTSSGDCSRLPYR